MDFSGNLIDVTFESYTEAVNFIKENELFASIEFLKH